MPPAPLAPPAPLERWSEDLDICGRQVIVTDGHAVLPEGLTHLPPRAFRNRTSLVCACPSSLVSIGDGAFFGCSALEYIHPLDSLTSIGEEAFCGCVKLSRVTLPSRDTLPASAIGCNAFPVTQMLGR